MSVNVKEWYLAEIYARIVAPLGADKATVTLMELREHLEETEAEFVSRGVSDQQAAHAAMDRLGTPSRVAREFVRTASASLVKNWSVALALLVVVAASLTLIPMQYGYLVTLAVPVVSVYAGLVLRRRLSGPTFFAAGVLAFGLFIVSISNLVHIKDGGTMTYGYARDNYKRMLDSNSNFRILESQAAQSWRETIKGLSPSNTAPIEIAKVEYRIIPDDASRSFRERGRIGGTTVDWSRMGTIFDPSAWKPKIVTNTVRANDAKSYVRLQLTNLHSYQRRRELQLAAFQSALNTSRIDRIESEWTSALPGVIIWVGGSWCLAAIAASLASMVMTRRRKLMA